MQPTLMTLKILLPFEIFAEKTGVSRIVDGDRCRFVRSAAASARLRGRHRAGDFDL